MFKFKPADFVPYKNEEVLERCRKITREEMTKHPNPDFRIHVVDNPGAIWIGDMVARIQASDIFDKKCVMILPNPCPVIYCTVAEIINLNTINCRNVYVFTMDEWADNDGNIAPADYQCGFTYSQLKYFYGSIR